jgi:hypothetical protein
MTFRDKLVSPEESKLMPALTLASKTRTGVTTLASTELLLPVNAAYAPRKLSTIAAAVNSAAIGPTVTRVGVARGRPQRDDEAEILLLSISLGRLCRRARCDTAKE